MERGTVLCLTGDVMTGRGVDQILPAPGDPRLWEGHVDDARTYVELAAAAHGPIPAPVDVDWPWGEALPVMAGCDLRLLNVETSVTTSDLAVPGKAVHYRMSPGNAGCLTAARPDACALANNHVLDFGAPGLEETLEVLSRHGLHPAGAGRDETEAWRPVELASRESRVLVWSVAASDSGVPAAWAARPGRPGVAFVGDLSRRTCDALCARVERTKSAGGLVVVSVHWGSNWGHRVPHDDVRFAHRLVDAGVDVVHGHSSHHPRPLEVYRDRLVLYGCGDLVNDYEGIETPAHYRGDLRPLYLATLDRDGRLRELVIPLFQARRMRLRQAPEADQVWLARTLSRAGRRFGSRLEVEGGTLRLVQTG
jgi:poly-gamma-glutamate synthesis protein (capsule biosynthesis protein)